ncbi:MAG: diaminopimelate epimerase [Sphingomicrobium sp.]
MARIFHKMHGLGNDFAIFDARDEPLAMSEALARTLADRHGGIGCDQLIVLEASETADLRMRIWNHDGGEVESCGNASRCVVALTGAKSIETGGGVVGGAMDGTAVEVAIGEPRFGWDEVPLAYAMDTAALPMAWGELAKPMALSVGNPHLVFFVDDGGAVPLDGLGPLIEHDPAFPDRINVNVAQVGGGGIRLRTWERGAGLTLACGTGACAAGVAAIASKRAQSPVTVTMSGGSLVIAWQPGEPVRMRGAATYVFKGEIDLEQFG